jgi:hypothetical protein
MMIPAVNDCWRYTGPGPAHGILQRIVLLEPHEVVSVQESPFPRFSWLGSVEDFQRFFVFIVGPAPMWDRSSGNLH